MAANDPNKYAHLPLVPETVLKKRHDMDEVRRRRQASALVAKPGGQNKINNGKKGKQGFYVKKLESLISQSKSRRHGKIRYDRVLKKGMQTRASDKKTTDTKDIEVEADEEEDEEPTVKTVTYQSNSVGAPLVFVIRVRDHHGACPMVKRALSRMRLRNINEGVFLRYDASHRKLLQLVEPWVVYGHPMKGVVEDLVERRGFGTIDGKRVALSDNTIIEQALGDDCGIICREDMVHELNEVGGGFTKVAQFLWPFRLSHQTTHFERETLRFTQGKNYGDKGERINEFIKQML